MIQQIALEIKIQTTLSHKNILGIYGFFDDATYLYIVLEYMQQGTLYSQLKKHGILQEKEVAAIILQITHALNFLHDHEVAHRDIKPQNIVINNVYLVLFRMFISYVTSAGQLSATNEEKPTAEPQIIPHLRSSKGANTTSQWTCGVWAFSPMNCWSGKLLFIT